MCGRLETRLARKGRLRLFSYMDTFLSLHYLPKTGKLNRLSLKKTLGYVIVVKNYTCDKFGLCNTSVTLDGYRNRLNIRRPCD